MYCDMKMLVYPRRGVYMSKDRHENYQMLKVLLNTLCSDELSVMLKISRGARVVYHEEEGVIEIDMPDGKVNHKDEKSMQELLHKLHDLGNDYAWEVAVLPQDHESRKHTYHKSNNVINPLMRIKPTIEVSI